MAKSCVYVFDINSSIGCVSEFYVSVEGPSQYWLFLFG